ncbi:MAG: hypothetical protein GC152_05680 [Alphaproteobacteria bacterium]|nr:hypothetical protein [Alphaproteobacteria bacterium]
MANVAAAVIIALAIIWTGGASRGQAQSSDREFAEWYARAVGDIRNDIVVNCGCCGDEANERQAAAPF